jgi:hypothetical protein
LRRRRLGGALSNDKQTFIRIEARIAARDVPELVDGC